MNSIDLVYLILKDIMIWAMPGATVVFLIGLGLRMAWSILKGGRLR